jgi:hypothetical protein
MRSFLLLCALVCMLGCESKTAMGPVPAKNPAPKPVGPSITGADGTTTATVGIETKPQTE